MYHREKSLKKEIFRNFVILTVVSVFFIGMVWIGDMFFTLRKHIGEIRAEYTRDYKNTLRSEVGKVVDHIDYHRKRIDKDIRIEIQKHVYNAHSMASGLYWRNAGIMSESQRLELIREALRPIRFNNGRGYYFMTRLDGTELLFADHPELEGKNLLESPDRDVGFLIGRMIKIARNEGEGFISYNWTKPGVSGSQHRKIAFVKRFDDLNCLIGTGEYYEDVDDQMKEVILSWSKTIRFGRGGHICIVDTTGKIILQRNPSHGNRYRGFGEGHPYWGNGGDIGRIVKSKGVSAYQYTDKRPGIPPAERNVIAYAMFFPDWGWVVEAAMPEIEVNEAIEAKQREMWFAVPLRLGLSLLLLGIMGWFVFKASTLLYRKIDYNVDLFSGYFNDSISRYLPMELSRIHYAEFQTIADRANKMLGERQIQLQRLHESEEKFRLLAEQTFFGIAIFDRHTVLFANQAFCEIMGVPMAELMSYPREKVKSFMAKEYREEAASLRKEALATNPGGILPFTFPIIRSNGESRWIEAFTQFLTIGGNLCDLLTVRDITDIHLVSEKIRESEQKFRNIFENAPVGIFQASVDGKILSANQVFDKLIGDKSLNDLADTIRKLLSEKKTGSNYDPDAWLSFSFDSTNAYEFTQYLYIKIRSMTNDRGVPMVEGFVEDVTEQRVYQQQLYENEQLYRLLAENTTDLISAERSDGHLTYVSPACGQFGYTPDEMLGRTWKDFIHSEDWDYARDIRIESDTGGKSVSYRIICKDGGPVWVETTGRAIRAKDGPVTEIVKVTRNITSRKEYEMALRETNQSLEEMVHITSHDLQSPLISMEGYATELLEQHADKLDDDGIYCLKRVQANTRRMHKLVNSLLDLSRLNTRQYPNEWIDMDQLVHDVVRDIDLQIVEKGVNLVVKELPKVLGDQVRLGGLIRNLLMNAVIYGAKNITVGHESGHYFVRDDGIGIPVDQLERIFRPGERLNKNDAPGVGMGLTYCRKVVQKHRGKIWAESAGAGSGATFRFTLGG